ncbi:MAG: L-idonate 5-dehydrogenase [Alphaproteobacteria bacterium]|nr:L-idonate 5-dehydrogenase [Alphaproteobacteria bacterium]
MKTRIARLHVAHDLRIETIDVAEPAAGEVLVSIGAGGICGSDLHYYHHGGFGAIRVREPIILGHEVAGTVKALGAGVSNVKIGDKVALNPSLPCGSCQYCDQGLHHHCLDMLFFGSAMRMPHVQGAFREAMVVKAEQCIPLADHVSLAEGACAEPLAVCTHARNQAGELNGKKVLVTGAGPIGALCVALAVEAGAAEIVVTDIQDATLKIAQQMGATKAINTGTNPDAMIEYAANKGHFDVVFECSGAPVALSTAIDCIRSQGIIVQVGIGGETNIPLNVLVAKEIVLKGTFRFNGEYIEAVKLINNGKIDVKPIITGRYKLEDAVAAFDTAGDRSRSVKVIIEF